MVCLLIRSDLARNHFCYSPSTTLSSQNTGADLDPSFGRGRRDDPGGWLEDANQGQGSLIEMREVYVSNIYIYKYVYINIYIYHKL